MNPTDMQLRPTVPVLEARSEFEKTNIFDGIPHNLSLSFKSAASLELFAGRSGRLEKFVAAARTLEEPIEERSGRGGWYAGPL